MVLDSLHDWDLVNLLWVDNDLTIIFKKENAAPVTLVLLGVHALRIDGMREGNIVSDVMLFNDSNFDSHQCELESWLQYLVAGESLIGDNQVTKAYRISVKNIMDSIAIGKEKCLCLKSSYGATIVCVHNEIKIKN